MPSNPDFRDLFSIFNEEQVEYLVAGAHAVMFHAEPRYTKDLDIWVNPTPANAERVYRALQRFGAPLTGVTSADFTNPELIYQIGVAPNRIDVMMGIAGADFPAAWADRAASTYDGVPISIFGPGHPYCRQEGCRAPTRPARCATP
jgi:hypothetical protein